MGNALAEVTVTMPVVNPETGAASRSFLFAGRVDRIEDGLLIDWKCVFKPSEYLSQHIIGHQLDLYTAALQAAGHEIRGVQFRLIARPSIRLKQKQTPADYEAEVFAWLHESGSDGPRLLEHDLFVNRARIESATALLHDTGKAILEARRHDRWLRNEGACFAYGRPCEFLRVCETRAMGGDPRDILNQSFKKRESRHELMGIEEDGKDLLTHSSMSAFARCQELYNLRYEHGWTIDRQEDSEALFVGKLFHDGAEAMSKAGLDEALELVSGKAETANALGEAEWRKVDEMVAKTRGMLRAAAERWPGMVGNG